MKGLDALDKIINSFACGLPIHTKDIAIIKNELKALEIIKPLVSVIDYRGTYYLVINEQGIQIDREKYELLSEVLL